jgi:hypothetical protein
MNSREKSEEPIEETRFDWVRFADPFIWRDKSINGLTWQFLEPEEGGKYGSNYRPLEEKPELFDEFWRLDSPEAIARFAAENGWLGLAAYNQFDNFPGEFGEPLHQWMSHIKEMKVVLVILDLVQASDSEALREFIHWDQPELVRFGCRIDGERVRGCDKQLRNANFRQEVLASRDFGSQNFKVWQKGESLGPAKRFVAMALDKALHKQVSPRLVVDPKGTMKAYYYPSSLIAALWLQVYKQAIGETRFRKCDICSRRMDTTENRTNKKVHNSCSLRMRMQRYRRVNG